MPRRPFPVLMVSYNNPVAHPYPGHTIKTATSPYTPICTIPYSPGSYDKQTKYAALFAVSPDLLEALQLLLRHCVTPTGVPDKGKGRTPDQQRALDKARNALAKASSGPIPPKKSAKS